MHVIINNKCHACIGINACMQYNKQWMYAYMHVRINACMQYSRQWMHACISAWMPSIYEFMHAI